MNEIKSVNVSVVIPSYNSAETLGDAIESVLAQSYQDYEIIIIDDGSTDNTREVVTTFINTNTNPKIYYRYQPNSGRSQARNHAIALAEGKYIAFLDADDLWHAEKLEKQLRLFKDNPQLGLVYSDLMHFDGRTGKDIELHSRRVKFHRGQVWEALLLGRDFIPTPTVIVPKRILEAQGRFDPDFMIMEDWELWLRMAPQYQFDYVDEELARARVSPTTTSWNSVPDEYYKYYLMMVDKAVQYAPAPGPKLNEKIQRRRARIHYTYSVLKMRQGQLNEAWQALLISWKQNRFYVKTYLRFLQLSLLRLYKRAAP